MTDEECDCYQIGREDIKCVTGRRINPGISENLHCKGERVSRIKEDVCIKRELFGANIGSDEKQVEKNEFG